MNEDHTVYIRKNRIPIHCDNKIRDKKYLHFPKHTTRNFEIGPLRIVKRLIGISDRQLSMNRREMWKVRFY